MAFYMYFKLGLCTAKMIVIKENMENPPEVEIVRKRILLINVVLVIMCLSLFILAINLNMSSDKRHYIWGAMGTSIAIITAYGGALCLESANTLIDAIKGSLEFSLQSSQTTNEAQVTHLRRLKKIWIVIKWGVGYTAAPIVTSFGLCFWAPVVDILKPYLLLQMNIAATLVYMPIAFLIKIKPT